MSGAGAARIDVTGAQSLRVAIVAASWHEEVMAGLIAGAQRVCDGAGVHTQLYRVPGSFELPLAVQAAARAGYAAVIALGVVVQGGTPHFEYVCRAATDGLGAVALETGVPVGFGLLTCDNEEQARDRAGLPGSQEDKGGEAAEAALAMAVLLHSIKNPGPAGGTGFSVGVAR